ncbi:MAG: Ppx/GppA phosphatase family protein [Verrucomicrobiota bacterium]
MNVAVIDVGSNTIRVLVGTRAGGTLVAVARGKRVVASPGRQARNADQLVRLIARASGAHARVLTQEEEARLAFEGALADVGADGAVAVCDVGGGSAQIAVGAVDGGPAWLRSIDLGSLRLSARVGHGDPPTKSEQAALRAEARSAVSVLTPPTPRRAVAVGGSARALRKLVGRSLGSSGAFPPRSSASATTSTPGARVPCPPAPRSWPRSRRSSRSRSRWGRPACARVPCFAC